VHLIVGPTQGDGIPGDVRYKTYEVRCTAAVSWCCRPLCSSYLLQPQQSPPGPHLVLGAGADEGGDSPRLRWEASNHNKAHLAHILGLVQVLTKEVDSPHLRWASSHNSPPGPHRVLGAGAEEGGEQPSPALGVPALLHAHGRPPRGHPAHDHPQELWWVPPPRPSSRPPLPA